MAQLVSTYQKKGLGQRCQIHTLTLCGLPRVSRFLFYQKPRDLVSDHEGLSSRLPKLAIPMLAIDTLGNYPCEQGLRPFTDNQYAIRDTECGSVANTRRREGRTQE
ncbi:Protein of unknown function [Cotesia congregata]|uniref:Uncharacterized protein n=1 Tax=Cotesia congregata TaxID=51543 RepID=A0A8J2EAH2_COTCN|nr:Protein of unknown function [Cotesia congregata]